MSIVKLVEWGYSLQALREIKDYFQKINTEFSKGGIRRYRIPFNEIHFTDILALFFFRVKVDETLYLYPNSLVSVLGRDGNQNSLLKRCGMLSRAPAVNNYPLGELVKNGKSSKVEQIKLLTASAIGIGVGNENKLACEIADMMGSNHIVTAVQIDNVAAAITEALHNVRGWAYSKSMVNTSLKNWWLTGHINKTQTAITVHVYDSGYSLPRQFAEQHLEDPRLLKYFTDKSGKNITEDDAKLIDAAFAFGVNRKLRTDTGGKGLVQMRRITKLFNTGMFSVTSGNGHYQSWSRRGITIQSRAELVPHKMDGTLLTWSLEYGVS